MSGFEKECGNCCFYYFYGDEKNGFCRRKSPDCFERKVSGSDIIETITEWPKVWFKDWCGEFKFKWEGR